MGLDELVRVRESEEWVDTGDLVSLLARAKQREREVLGRGEFRVGARTQ